MSGVMKYRPVIDGMRAIAVMAQLTYVDDIVEGVLRMCDRMPGRSVISRKFWWKRVL